MIVVVFFLFEAIRCIENDRRRKEFEIGHRGQNIAPPSVKQPPAAHADATTGNVKRPEEGIVYFQPVEKGHSIYFRSGFLYPFG